MKSKQLMCNDCGCRFEIKDERGSVSQPVRGKEAVEDKTRDAPLSCPECRSFNITTA